MTTLSFILTLSLSAAVAAIGIALAPKHRKAVAIASVIGLSAIAASAPALADFSSNPSGHAHPAPQITIGAYTLGTPNPSCSWTNNTTLALNWTSSSSAWSPTGIQRWVDAPPFAGDYQDLGVGTTSYNDTVTAGTQYDYQFYTYSGTNWTSPMSSTLASNTCTNAIDSVARPVATATLHQTWGTALDSSGDIAIADTGGNYVEFVPKYAGTYFGVSMVANYMKFVLGTGVSGTTGDGVAQSGTLDKVNGPQGVAFDSHGNIVVADTGGHEIRVIAKTTGTYYGVSMTAGQVYSIAGTAGSAGDSTSGVATSGLLHSPSFVALDANDNVYISDTANNRIKAVCNKGAGSPCTLLGLTGITQGNLALIAGNGVGNYVDSNTIANQEMNNNDQIAFNPAGTTLYIADTTNHVVRAVTANTSTNTSLTTFAGSGGSGDAAEGTAKASATFAVFDGVTVDSSGNVIIADTADSKIKIIPAASCSAGTCAYGYPGAESQNSLYTIAGTGGSGDRGTGYPTYNGGSSFSKIGNVRSVAMGPDGYVYFGDGTNDKVRALKPDSSANPCSSPNTTTCNNGYDIVDVVGSGASSSSEGVAAGDEVQSAQGVAADSSGNVYFADPTGNVIREYIASTGRVRVVAGTGVGGGGGDGGLAVQATLNAPTGVALDATNGMLFIAANGNQEIRGVCVKATGTCTSIGSTVNAGYIAEVAGTGVAGTTGNGTAIASAKVNTPQDVAWDATNSRLYIADTGSDTIKEVYNSSGWKMDVVAGTSGTAGSLDNNPATSGTLNTPTGVAVDSNGAVYIADSINFTVRKFTIATPPSTPGALSRIAGQTGSAGSTNGNALTTAKFNWAADVAVDSSGTIFVADNGNDVIRCIAPAAGAYCGQGSATSNTVYTLVGTVSNAGYTNDDGYYGSALIYYPEGVAVANGNLFIGQTGAGANAGVRVVYGQG
jgi:sugar lactone lactonase YvrE